jgi:hypothetical protein
MESVSMRLYNTIAIYDVYIVAESSDTARETLISAISSGEIKPTESTAVEIVRAGAIRKGFADERPFVAVDVSENDYTSIAGKTTLQIFEHIYTKRG